MLHVVVPYCGFWLCTFLFERIFGAFCAGSPRQLWALKAASTRSRQVSTASWREVIACCVPSPVPSLIRVRPGSMDFEPARVSCPPAPSHKHTSRWPHLQPLPYSCSYRHCHPPWHPCCTFHQEKQLLQVRSLTASSSCGAGILIYNGLVDLIIPTFTDKDMPKAWWMQALGFGSLFSGAAVMSLIAKWA